MTLLRIFTTTSAVALVAGPAFAELTADDVWNEWQEMLSSYGGDVTTAGQNRSGDTLTVSGVTTSFTVHGGSMSMTLGDIAFAEQGDGSVVVTIANAMPVMMDIADPNGKTSKVGYTIATPGGSMTASGDAGNLRYDFDYPSMTVSDFTVEGDEIPQDLPIVMDIVATGITGFITMSGDDVRNFDSDATVGLLTMDMGFEEPGEGSAAVKISMADLTQSVTGVFTDIEMDMSMAEIVQAGMSQSGTGTYGPATMQMSVDGPDGGFEFAAAAEGGTLDMNFDEGGINYGGITNAITMTIGGSAIPFPPLSFSMDRSEGRIVMPLIPNADEAQDFGLRMTLEGLSIDDMLWGMFDPTGQLPHDPATLILDLGGSAVVMEDFTSPKYAEAMERMEAGPPGTLETLDVNALQLSFAGAELTGDGDFAFNNDMGIPLPSGTANLMLTGGNGLLDKLVGMGLVPEDQAMGARMMLGLFARPGDGPDTLVSTIEVNEDGSILANGQRIK